MIKVEDLRKQVGAVFQNVETYALSVAENILLRSPQTEEDEKIIEEALKRARLENATQTIEYLETKKEYSNRKLYQNPPLHNEEV